MKKTKKKIKKNYHQDLAFRYRGVQAYHVLYGLEADGRQNAVQTEFWLSWSVLDRDYDNAKGSQFDVRDLENGDGEEFHSKPEYVSPGLPEEAIPDLMLLIDQELQKPKHDRVWVKDRKIVRNGFMHY